MGAQRTTFDKLQRDRAKKAKAAAKRQDKIDRKESAGQEEGDLMDVSVSDFGPELSAAELLKLVEALHAQFDAEKITFEEFEEQKTELFARLPVE
jgi:hypothetical protein